MDANDDKRISLSLPSAFYEQFCNSQLRKMCATDNEAIRTAIRQAMETSDKQPEQKAS